MASHAVLGAWGHPHHTATVMMASEFATSTSSPKSALIHGEQVYLESSSGP